MKKPLYATILLIVAALIAACGQAGQGGGAAAPTTAPVAAPTTAPQATEADCARPEVLCVGLVTDVGEIDDKSFNQSAWEGVKRAERELGAIVNYVETKDAKDYAANIGLFTEKGYDVIVTVGFALTEATTAAAGENPNVKFIGVDQFQAEAVPNVAGLIFAEDKAGFLAGVLAAEMSKSNKIAAVLGTNLVPPVVAFKEGYENGARYAKPDIQIISTYHPGGLDTAFTDPKWGGDQAKLAIDQGADVIFGAGGKTGNGALIETAANQGVFCIGVDTDQWETVPEAHPCLISSAMKLITPGVFDLIQKAKDGAFPSGNYVGEVGLAPFHDFDSQVPQEVKARLAEVDKGLRDGSIPTGYNPGG
ncbi:MAG: BMP family ABC transporter substrate-binding protein [Chloroflexi bacterium]|nr:BMP family ABC transporter substrate-binding protein [Chloroflexota bacterium]